MYIDESGFAPTTERDYGWAPKGQKVYGMRSGNRRPRTSLIAARIGRNFLFLLLDHFGVFFGQVARLGLDLLVQTLLGLRNYT